MMKHWIRFFCLSLLSIVAGMASAQDVVEISTVEGLKAFRDAVNSGTSYAGKTVKLTSDLDLNSEDWFPIGYNTMGSYPGKAFKGEFDGCNHTISNLKVYSSEPNYATAGFFGSIETGSIKNLTLKNVDITSTHFAGGIVAYTSNDPTIENCHVIGGTIKSTPEFVNGEWNNGDKVGGIMGYATAGSTINKCTVEGVTISGYRDLGGIVGYSDGNVTNNTAKNVTVTQDLTNGYKDTPPTTIGDIVGRGSATNNVEANGNKVIKSDPVAQIGETKYETIADAVKAAKANDVIEIIKAGDYKLPNLPNNVTIEGKADGVVFKDIVANPTNENNIASIPSGATFKNVAFEVGNINYHGFTHAGIINMEGCTLNGKLFSYGDMNFTNCQFNQSNSDYHMWCYAGNVTYNNCTFTNEKTGKFLNVYNEDGTTKYTVTVNNCKFVNQATSANKAALNVKATCSAKLLTYDVIINNCTTEGAFPEASESQALVVLKDLVQVDDRTADGVDNIKVYENDVLIYPVNYVAKIGNVKYETLEAAFAAAQNDETITLLADIDANEQIEVGKQVTLDLNGKTIEYKSEATLTSGVIMVLRGGDLTVTDSSEGATGAIKSGTKAFAAIALTKKGETGTETAKLTVNNGTIEGYYYAIVGNGTRHGTDITIAGGTVKGTKEKSNQGIYHPQDGTLTISGGTISGYSSAVELRSGTLNITGGTLSASCTEFNYEPNNSGTTTDGAVIAIAQHSTLKAINVSIKGATLEGAKTIAVTDAQNNNLKDITVSVADALTEKAYIPEGFKWVSADGMSTLTKKEYVAQVGDVKYETLKEALDAAKDNENIVVELLADATLDLAAWSGVNNKMSIGSTNTKSITINGNNHQLTFNQTNSDWNNVATMNDAETKLILNDMAITNSGHNEGTTWNKHDINFNCAVELNNVTSDKALAFKNDATIKNVTITETAAVYGIWIQPHGQNVSIDGLTLTAQRGIKIDDQYVDNPEKVTLDIANATFNTTKKAGVLVKSKGGADITVGKGINIENVAADKENLVWVDEASATEFYKVTVAGATVVPESKVSDYVACVMNGEQSWGFYKKLSDAVNNVEEGFGIKLHQTTTEAVEVSKPLTITKNGFTADNVTAGEGYKRFESETEIVIRSFNPICAIGDNKYETLAEAVAAAGTSEATITLLTEAATDGVISGAGVVVPSGSNITFDLNGLTYNVSGETVGSSTTETQGFQLLKNSNITFKNGTLKATSPTAQMVIQNYSNLTLEDVNVDGTGLSGWAYALSNNCGTINLTGSTSITAKEGGRAFDTCKFGDYAIPTVNINTTGVISGPIEATGGKLNIENGKFDVTWVTDSHYAAGDIQIKGGVFTAEVDEEYCAEGFVCTDNDDETYMFTVKSKEEAGIFELDDVKDQIAYPYPAGGNAKKITYKRTFSQNNKDKYQSWMVPFNYTITNEDLENFLFYKINFIAPSKTGGVVGDNTKVYIFIEPMKQGDVLKGNKPYVIKPNKVLENYEFVSEGENIKLYPATSDNLIKPISTTAFEYYFYGTFGRNDFKEPDQVLFMYSGNIVWNDENNYLRTYRWFIKPEAKGSDDYAKPNIFIVEGDDDTDGINNAQAAEGEIQGIYTLGGIKVEHPVKGVNIIKYTDGRTKKIYVK